ncbi:hypothetical protein TSUD_340510 [Trifolium subterraneum]|uniref:Leucine-rich repeat-containing N-terminal plant-type domain-containing protein n=1 Tax=Trifolium subterraneum TaxID=3900 RepID=A0A2Z6LNF0_TRISU|nr:hypothetical protein TSUD_340510 [Trifolium subterraneum]
MNYNHLTTLLIFLFLLSPSLILTTTHPTDLKILNDFKNNLDNPELLQWPKNNNDPCGPPSWKFIFCDGDRVTQIQTKNLNLSGTLPQNLNQLTQLFNLGLQNNKLHGSLPSLKGLSNLKYAYLDNNEFDTIPFDFFQGLSSLEILALDNNNLNVTSNGFSGSIPENIGDLVSLKDLNLNGNELVGIVPKSLVMALLGFLGGLNYPSNLVDSWIGNNPCESWLGIKCNTDGSLAEIRLGGNNLNGVVPSNWTGLMKLNLLDLTDNNISPPMPVFSNGLKPMVDGNSLLNGGGSSGSPSSGKNSTSGGSGDIGGDIHRYSNSSSTDAVETKKSKRKGLVLIVAPIAGVAFAAFLLIPLYVYCFRRTKDGFQAPSSLVVHPRDPSDSDSTVKIAIANNGNGSVSTLAGSGNGMTGKITTKVDVFSFGVVLMELLSGLMALDESRPEESQYLAAWFWNIKSDKKRLMAAIDPTLDINEETFESVAIIAELAGHCTAREPNQRPEMGHAVNVLAPLVEKWKPFDDDPDEYSGIDYSLPLNQMVKGWQEAEGKDTSYMDLEDSKSSIPARPTGFADSFTSADGR